jgi:hypothetical protein
MNPTTTTAANDTTIPATLQPGEKVETAAWRIRRCMDGITATHIVNAGKRGKKCATLALWSDEPLDLHCTQILPLAARGASVEEMTGMMQALATRSVTFRAAEERGVDVPHAAMDITGPALRVVADGKSFSIRCLQDRANEPVMIDIDNTGPARVLAWARSSATAIAGGMTYSRAREELRELGVKVHSYCAMD